MTTTVKLGREAKRELEKLQATLLLEHGVRASQQSIVEAAIRLAWKRREELLEELLGGWKPVEDPEKLLDELAVDMPVEDTVNDIDRVVYGKAVRGAERSEDSGS